MGVEDARKNGYPNLVWGSLRFASKLFSLGRFVASIQDNRLALAIGVEDASPLVCRDSLAGRWRWMLLLVCGQPMWRSVVPRVALWDRDGAAGRIVFETTSTTE